MRPVGTGGGGASPPSPPEKKQLVWRGAPFFSIANDSWDECAWVVIVFLWKKSEFVDFFLDLIDAICSKLAPTLPGTWDFR